MIETFEAWVGFVLVLLFFGTLFGCLLLWYATGLAGIQKSGFWRSLFGALFAAAVTYLLGLGALAIGSPVKTLHGLAAGLLLSLFIIKAVYRTSLIKAMLPWLFFAISQAIVVLAATELLIGSLSDLIEIIQ